MSNSHLIDTFLFDISFDNEDKAFEQQNHLNTFVRRNLISVVNNVFNDSSIHGIRIKIEVLDIDLGVVSYSDYQDELPRRLKDKLKSILSDLLIGFNAGNDNKNSNIRFVRDATNERQQIEYYLLHGYLSSNSILNDNEIASLFLRIISQDREWLVRLINQSNNGEIIIKRLTMQFSDEILSLIVQRLSPRFSEIAIDFIYEVKKLWTRHSGSKPLSLYKIERVLSLCWYGIIDLIVKSNNNNNLENHVFKEKIISSLFSHELGFQSEEIYPLIEIGNGYFSSYSDSFKRTSSISTDMGPSLNRSDFIAFEGEMIERFKFEDLLRRRIVFSLQSGNVDSISHMWNMIIEEFPAMFKEILYHYAKHSSICRQIISCFHESYIHDIVVLVEPMNYGFIESFINSELWFNNDYSAASVGVLFSRTHLFEFTLKYLIVDRGSLFNKKHYLSSLISQMATQYKISYRRLLYDLSKHTYYLSDPDDLIRQIQQLFVEIYQDSKVSEVSEEKKYDSNDAGFYDVTSINTDIEKYDNSEYSFRDRISLALTSGSVKNISGIWGFLIDRHANLLEELLFLYGQHKQIRKKIAYSFPGKYIHDIVALIEPIEHVLIEEIVENYLLFKEKNLDTSHDEVLKKQLWEFSLGYLLVERGSQFNKKSYLNSLIRQMAAHANVSYRELLHDLSTNYSNASCYNSRSGQIKQLLMEFSSEIKVDIAADEKANKDIHESYLHYDYLKQIFDGNSPVSSNERMSHRAIDTLLQSYPWLLIKLYRQLQCNELAWQAAINRLTVPFLNKAVLAFIAIQQNDIIGCSILNDAIVENSKKSHDLHRYYREILFSILSGEVINFDSILLHRLNASIVESETPRYSIAEINVVEDGVNSGLMGYSHLNNINNYFFGNEVFSDSKKLKLINFFENKSVYNEKDLKSMVWSIVKNKESLEKLINLLPENLLLRCLILLGMNDISRLLLCADILTSACYTGMIVQNDINQFNKIKWRYIFSYADEIGVVFNENNFVKGYVDSLIKDANQLDQMLFRSNISQQLVKNIIPSTRDITIKLIDSITKVATTQKNDKFIPSPHEAVLIKPSDNKGDNESQLLDNIYITNAGIVLAAPYLLRLFKMLKLTEGSEFINRESAILAVHALQFMVTGKTSAPEYFLVINKLLCGIKTELPIERDIEISDDNKKIVEGLLQGIIHNWSGLGNTSITGLRESFFQREGRLQLKNDAWHLLVEPKAFDMLLDKIPWGYTTIKYPWMEKVIYVEWR